MYVFVALFLVGVLIMVGELAFKGKGWAENELNRHVYSTDGTPSAKGSITDRTGQLLFSIDEESEKSYNSSSNIRKATLHLIGDRLGNISTGTERLYAEYMCDYSQLEGLYAVVNNSRGTNITLNVCAQANIAAMEAFKDRGGVKGCVLVYNYRTGELLCSVSMPTYDVEDIPQNIGSSEKYEGVYLDRTIKGLVMPGSVMKIVTGISAVENIADIDTRTFRCDGKIHLDDGSMKCVNASDGGCGYVSFEEAFNNSCNVIFTQAADEIGAAKLTRTANELGFNTDLFMADLVPIKMSRVNFGKTHTQAFSRASVGLGENLLMNPSHLLGIVGAIANGGTGYAPLRVKSCIGTFVNKSFQPSIMVQLNPDVCSLMDKYLHSNVTNVYTGEYGIDFSVDFAAKSGTGALNDDEGNNVWFAGYSRDESLPLAAVCMVENIDNSYGGGATLAGKIVADVMEYFDENRDIVS